MDVIADVRHIATKLIQAHDIQGAFKLTTGAIPIRHTSSPV